MKTPAALSLIVPESLIPSFSLTDSMISGSKGTNITEQEHPSRANPIDDSINESGNFNNLDGPNIKRATDATQNEKNVSHFLGTN